MTHFMKCAKVIHIGVEYARQTVQNGVRLKKEVFQRQGRDSYRGELSQGVTNGIKILRTYLVKLKINRYLEKGNQ